MTVTLLAQPATASATIDGRETASPSGNRSATTYVSSLAPLTHVVDPLAFLAAGSKHANWTALYWQPLQGKALVGIGAAHVHEATGQGRFHSLVDALASFRAALICRDRDQFPILAGGAFHDCVDAQSVWRDFPAAAFIVPSVLLQVDETGAGLRVTVAIDEGTSSAADEQMHSLFTRAQEWSQSRLSILDPPSLAQGTGDTDRAAWEDAVTFAVQEIHQQKLEKVVLARQESLEATGPLSAIQILQRLRAVNPGATLFSISHEDTWFLGASPERLVRLTDGNVDVSCLAGSIGLGNSDAERDQLAAELLGSTKDRWEHELVVGPIMRQLQDICDDVSRLPGTPRVVPARSVQHLETPISARLRGKGHVLDLVDRLHPTPAVGGYPRDVALQAIQDLETIERGWYAGPFGWTDLEGNGEFIVALRSALISGSSATVFAGCGIVGDSIPAREYDESRLKMRPMLTAMGAA